MPGFIEVLHLAQEDIENQDAANTNIVYVGPQQMRLLRKMSSVGLSPSDVDPYVRREKVVPPPDLGRSAIPLVLLAAASCPIIWSRDGIYYCCVPLLLVGIFMMNAIRVEVANLQAKRLTEEEAKSALALAALTSRKEAHQIKREHHAQHQASRRHSAAQSQIGYANQHRPAVDDTSAQRGSGPGRIDDGRELGVNIPDGNGISSQSQDTVQNEMSGVG